MLNPTNPLTKYSIMSIDLVNDEHTLDLLYRIQLIPIEAAKFTSIAVNENLLGFLVKKNRVDIYALVEFYLVEIQINEMNNIGNEESSRTKYV